jgi:hypothetical protein
MFTKITRIFKKPAIKEQLSSENMIFRNTEHTRLGAKIKKDNLGKLVSLEIWNVSPWPDDKVFMEFQLFPGQIKALKDFINLYEQQFGIQEEPPPISMLPKPRWWTEYS